MRNYETMRNVLHVVSQATNTLSYDDIRTVGTDDAVEAEIDRLARDGLLDGEVSFRRNFGEHSCCKVTGLTDEGREFWRLIENDKVWRLVHETLRKASIDVSYPLLKEVCEEIVRRYVTSFIPKTI